MRPANLSPHINLFIIMHTLIVSPVCGFGGLEMHLTSGRIVNDTQNW